MELQVVPVITETLIRYSWKQVTTSVWEGQGRLSEETIEPVPWAENNEEVLLVIEKRIGRGKETTATAVDHNQVKLPGAYSERKEWVEGLGHEGSECHCWFLSRDAARTSLLFNIVGSTVRIGWEER